MRMSGIRVSHLVLAVAGLVGLVSCGGGGGATGNVPVSSGPPPSTPSSNSAPIVFKPIPDLMATSGTSSSYTLPADTFSDPDGDGLTYTFDPLPSWLTFDPNSRTFSGVPAARGQYTVRVTVNDGNGGIAFDQFIITVGPNSVPRVANPIPDLIATSGTSSSYTFPADTFSDPDGDGLTYTIDPLPPWLTFDPNSRTFSGVPAARGEYTIRVTANDGNGGTAFDQFIITVPNSVPKVANPIPDQRPMTRTLFNYTLENTFRDADGDNLNYSFECTGCAYPGQSLPYWLNFDRDTGTFSGTPRSKGGAYTITVTVDDGYGGRISDQFTIDILLPSFSPVSSSDFTSHEPVWQNVKGIPVLIGSANVIWEDDKPSDGWENDLTDDDYSQTHGSARVGQRSGSNGATVSDVIRFLLAEFEGDADINHVRRWSDPPTVRIANGAGEQDRLEIITGVRMINSGLPPDWQLTVLDSGATESRNVGYIDVFFMPVDQWADFDEATYPDVIGLASTWSDPISRNGRLVASNVYVDSEFLKTSEERISTFLHEMLHALGRGHVMPAVFSDTLLHPRSSSGALNWKFAAPIDDALLLAVYRTLDVGKSLADFTDVDGNYVTKDFGNWNSDSFHVFGELPHTDSENLLFGSIWKNGQARPYVIGMDPAPAMTETEGSASWSGRLIGLTPDVKTVGGAMDMMLRFGATVEGDLDFTEMKEWDAEAGPGSIETGTQWTGGNTDGELHYGILVHEGLLFTETDEIENDAGRITGQFFGSDHEGAAGTLRRSDLTAGFAGKQPDE